MEIASAPNVGREETISAYQAKKDGTWEYWLDRIEGALTEYDLNGVWQEILQAHEGNELPKGWVWNLRAIHEARASTIKETEDGNFHGQLRG